MKKIDKSVLKPFTALPKQNLRFIAKTFITNFNSISHNNSFHNKTEQQNQTPKPIIKPTIKSPKCLFRALFPLSGLLSCIVLDIPHSMHRDI